jgi:hypothetical protein
MLALLGTTAAIVLGALLIVIGVYFLIKRRFILAVVLIVVGVIFGGLDIFGIL